MNGLKVAYCYLFNKDKNLLTGNNIMMPAFSRSSPISDTASDGGFTALTLRDKTLMKRNISRNHNTNFRAGYVPVHEQSLHKTGLRGHKCYAFWTLVLLLFLLALGNLLLTFIILGVLRLGQGMESIELMSEDSIIMFYGETDLDGVYKRDGKLEGFNNSPVEIIGDKNSVLINLVDTDGKEKPQIITGINGTIISGITSFEVKHPITHQPIFSTDYPNFGLPRGVERLAVKKVRTNRITSSVSSSLFLEADTYAFFYGTEGTHIEGKEIVWSADRDIFLKSLNGNVILSGQEGIAINVDRIPVVENRSSSRGASHYKVCVCMPSGKLFRIPVPEENPDLMKTCNHESHIHLCGP